MEKAKSKLKKEMRLKRQMELEKKRKTTRILVWSLSSVLVAAIVLLAIFWPKPAPLVLDYDNMPTIGSPDAKVKLVEFGDYKCPVCARFSQEIMSKIKTEFIDTGKISFSYQNWTIISPDADSFTAAMAGQAIYHQSNEAFWKFNDAMYRNQNPNERQIWATEAYILDLAKREGLEIDYDLLGQDLKDRKYAGEVRSQNNFAQKKNFTGTPTVLINGERLPDSVALSYDNLKAAIEAALQKAEAEAASSQPTGQS